LIAAPIVGNPAVVKIVVWHNLLWSPYKADVFSALARLAPGRGHEVFVRQICTTDRSRAALSPIDLSRHDYPYELLFDCSREDVFVPMLWLRVLHRTLIDRPDLTILSGYDRPEYWLQALALVGRRRAVFCDSTGLDRPRIWYKRLAKRLFFKLVPHVLCYGQRARAYVIDHGVRPERAFDRVQAASLPKDYDPTAIASLRGERAAPVDAPVFLYVGRLSPEKALPSMLQAFARIVADQPSARLRLVGQGPDGEALKELAAKLAPSGTIVFCGAKSGQALYDEYLAASALILPSHSEPWGLVVNEALHFGCPVVVSDRCGCVPELAERSECGFVYPCSDIDALTTAMRKAAALGVDPVATARACLAKVSPYTPLAAAELILDAAEAIAAA
jgi:glycosyltransferase involved in cell wall biosynthesis